MTFHNMSFHVDFSELVGGTSRLIWRATQLAAFALSAVDKIRDEDFGPLTMPGAVIGLGPAHVPQPQTRIAFRQWVIGCALRDSVESILLLLDEVRRTLAVSRLAKVRKVSGETWLAYLEAERAFHRLGLARKFESLQKEFGFTPEEDLTDDLVSLNAARNCLVHRLGRVGKIDCDDRDTLKVSWLGMEMRTVTSGETIVVESLPVVMKAGAELQVVWQRKSKAFALGEQVEFSTSEFSEIGLFLQTYTSKIAALAQKLADLPVREEQGSGG